MFGVSGEHRPLRMPPATLAISCGDKTPPRTYCIQEFANDNTVIDTMYGFLTKFLWSKDSKGMYGLCTSMITAAETCSLTDRSLLTVTPYLNSWTRVTFSGPDPTRPDPALQSFYAVPKSKNCWPNAIFNRVITYVWEKNSSIRSILRLHSASAQNHSVSHSVDVRLQLVAGCCN